ERFRPLPGRENVVVTRDPSYLAEGATVGGSFEEALETLGPVDRVCNIGGGQPFVAAMPLATELVVTQIALEVEGGDTFAPEIGPEWRLARSSAPAVSTTGLGYRFEWYRRAT